MNAIRLRREGDYVYVDVEYAGAFVEVIREPHDNQFCHIVEPSGIQARLKQHLDSLPSPTNRCAVCKFKDTGTWGNGTFCGHTERKHNFVSRETDENWKGACGPTFAHFVIERAPNPTPTPKSAGK